MANIKELIQSIESPDSSFDEKLAVINEMQDTLVAMKEHEQEAIDDNVELIIEALRTIEAKVEAKLRIIPEKGEQGIQGQKGEQGDRGLDGAQGKDGKSGIDGKDGLDGKDGVSVQDAKIDFDGSLVITLSDGREINVGEVVPVDVAEKIRTVHNIQSGSGGDSQTVLDAIAALQATIATYGTMATQNKTSVAITGGTINNTTIGATTPSTGVFTTLTGNSTSQFGRSSTNYVQIVGAATTVAPNISAQGGDTNIPLRLSSKNDATIYGVTNGVISFDTYAPSGSVNYLRLRGNATGVGAAVESFGSDSNVDIILSTKGTGALRTYTNGNQQLAVTNTASAVNYVQVTGGATTKGVIQSAQGSDSNISYVTQSKGTGAIDLAAGSSGVNISNGGTVTAITRTATGSGYTAFPSVAITAPTTAGGVQATASVAQMVSNTATIQVGGTGYTLNDVVTLVGGTPATVASTYTVTAVTGGVVTAVTPLNFTAYTVLPTNPVSVTGGTGTGLTLNVTYAVQSSFTITNAGSGYVEQPTVTFSGGGGSGAAAYATVGSNTSVKSLGTSLLFYTPAGVQGQFSDSGGATPTAYPNLNGSSFGLAYLTATGSATNAGLVLASKGTSPVDIYTNSTGSRAASFSHTASAVNYVQVTGAATGSTPIISIQGSDSAITGAIQTKGGGSFSFYSQANLTGRQVRIDGSQVAVNYLDLYGSVAGFAPSVRVGGSDTDIPLVLQPKGTGALQAQQTDSTATGGNARGANAVDWQTSRSTAAQVASQQFASILSGDNNTASAYSASVLGGRVNVASGIYSSIGGGYTNSVSGPYSGISNGSNNTAAGWYNYIGGGFTNSGTANGAVTTQSGTMNATTAVTLSGSNASIKVGQYITGTSIAGDTYVAAISGTSLTLSKVASGSSTSTLSFFTPHGVVVGGGNNQATGSYSFIGGGGDAGTAANRNVASGDWSFVGGGIANQATGLGSVICGGGWFSAGSSFAQSASGVGAGVLSGSGNYASGDRSAVLTGYNNGATTVSALVGGGFQSVATGQYSTALNGHQVTTRGIYGSLIYGGRSGFGLGGGQAGNLVLTKQTTDATPTVLVSDIGGAGTTNQVILPNNSAYYFKGSVIANVTGGGNTKAWSIEGAIKRGANAASTALVGTPTVTSAYADVGAATWAIAVTADTTNGGLAVTFTGQASTTIRCVAKLETTEVTF